MKPPVPELKICILHKHKQQSDLKLWILRESNLLDSYGREDKREVDGLNGKWKL